MFRFESLELLYWDYWERVKIPLDEGIIIIVGPNGSGKTTALDSIRTLLGTKTSEKRDYKRYARKSNKPYSWIVATVKKQRDRSNRPCSYPIVDDRVTLACRIEKKGGEWQRGYFIMPGAQAQCVDMADAIEGIRRNVTGLKREVESMRASIADMESELKGLKDIENTLKKDRDSVSSYIQELQQRLIEDNRKRASIEASISEIEKLSEDVKGLELQEIDALRQEHESAVKKAGLLEQEIENTDKNIGEIKARISALKAGIIKPDRPIEEFSLLLKSEGIQHSFLYEGVEVINEKWGLAIESILRGYRYIIILNDPAQKWKAWELGERSGYRHFIVADIGNRDIQTPKGSALSAVRLKDFVPEWIRRQIADIYLVDTVKEGQSLPEGGTFVTAKGYMKERRGGRAIAVSEGDFIFDISGKKRQLEFLIRQKDEFAKQKEAYNARLRTTKEHISTLSETIRLQEALRRYFARKDEENNLRKELPTVNKTIDSTEKELKSLYEKNKALDSQYEINHDKLIKLQRDIEGKKEGFKKKINDCKIQRKELLDKILEFRRHRAKMPPEWRTVGKITSYKEKFEDIKIVNRAYEDVARKLNEGQWEEKNPKIIELKAKIEQDYNGELTNLKKKDYEDEPFAHLDVFNIDKVAEFLLATETQFIITSPNTHNTNVYRPAMLTIVTKKKRSGEEFAQSPGHIRRLNARA